MPGFGNIYLVTPIESDGVLLGRMVMMYSHEVYVSRFYSFVRQAVLTTTHRYSFAFAHWLVLGTAYRGAIGRALSMHA